MIKVEWTNADALDLQPTYINRQAAIDILEVAINDGWEFDYAKDRIIELTTQPEIIWCKECMFWNEGNCYCEDIAVRGLEYYVGDIYTEENDFCKHGRRE